MVLPSYFRSTIKQETSSISLYFSGSSTQQTRLRKVKLAMDTGPSSSFLVTAQAEDGRIARQTEFGDVRSTTAHTWGESGFKWGAEGVVWGSGSLDQRSIFDWNVPQGMVSPYGYQIQVETPSDGQDKTFRLYEIQILEKPRTIN